jgi:hypothetical protein
MSLGDWGVAVGGHHHIPLIRRRFTLKKTLVAFVVVLLAGLGLSFAQAEPGPNDHNEHGLCTAYFNGQKNGKSDEAGPFVALEDTAREYTDNDDVDNDGNGTVDDGDNTPDNPDDDENNQLSAAENIYNYCSNVTTIGGNEDNGRYDCVLDTDPNTDGNQTDCQDDNTPGHT